MSTTQTEVVQQQNSVLIRGHAENGGAWAAISADEEKDPESSPSNSSLKTAVSTTSIKESSGPTPCGRCRNPVKPTDQALECETCHQMFHTQCENVNKTQFNCISSSSKGKGKGKSRVHWYCNTCDIVTNDWMRSMSTLHANQQQLEIRVNTLEEKVDKKADKEDVEEIKNKVEVLERKINSAQENGSETPQPSTST